MAQAADLLQRGCICAEYARFPQHPKRRRRRIRATAHRGFGVEDLQHVADCDIGKYPALGGDDHRAAKHDVSQRRIGDRRVLLTQLTQPIKTRPITAIDHVADQLAFLTASQQPCQRRSHYVGADHQQQ
ncbi:hypothetical protein [Mycobacterium helveticum]|uniref:hypothetical protein n=1 Tax=Mycobacterium helveticum TaxID=2592811 RepID=UPI001FE3FE4A|nr:hypothetical protein [Mycobacterium helveticum]